MTIEEIRSRLRDLGLDPFAVGIEGERGASIDCGFLLRLNEHGRADVLWLERGRTSQIETFPSTESALDFVIARLRHLSTQVGTRSRTDPATVKRMKSHVEDVKRRVAAAAEEARDVDPS